MPRDALLLTVTVGVVALALLYAVFGPKEGSGQWTTWIVKAGLAAGAAFGIGILLVGLPGALFLEAVTGPGAKLPPDSAWPLSLMITVAGSLLIMPASLLMRLLRPGTIGWAHAGATAVLTTFATRSPPC